MKEVFVIEMTSEEWAETTIALEEHRAMQAEYVRRADLLRQDSTYRRSLVDLINGILSKRPSLEVRS